MTAVIEGTVAHAEQIARQAFDGLTNSKDGEPLIRHTERVVGYLVSHGFRGDVLSVAWLHDVVEDTDVTLDDLRAWFNGQVIRAVDSVTRRPGEALEDYLARVGANLLALRVKLLGDLPDNTNPSRRALLSVETRERLGRKYFRTYKLLIPWTTTHPAW